MPKYITTTGSNIVLTTTANTTGLNYYIPNLTPGVSTVVTSTSTLNIPTMIYATDIAVDRIVVENYRERDFLKGDLVKSIDEQFGIFVKIIMEKLKENYKIFYLEVFFKNRLEIWIQYKKI